MMLYLVRFCLDEYVIGDGVRVRVRGDLYIFFFKQKTAYEIQYGLVGSEMCIRDSHRTDRDQGCVSSAFHLEEQRRGMNAAGTNTGYEHCLLYTSDAADERSSGDLGGRRIIKNKKHRKMPKHDVVQNTVATTFRRP